MLAKKRCKNRRQGFQNSYVLILNHQMKHYLIVKNLNTDIWYEEETYLWVKAAFR